MNELEKNANLFVTKSYRRRLAEVGGDLLKKILQYEEVFRKEVCSF